MRNILNFNSGWKFYKNITELSDVLRVDSESVSLPHTWNAVDGQDGGNDYFRGVCAYAKEFLRSELPKNEQYFLEFQGANSSATVYLNGRAVGHHEGGYSCWRVSITDVIEEENTLCILVDNAPNESIYPQVADFTFYGGLYRSVFLVGLDLPCVDPEQFGSAGVFVTPQISGEVAEVEIYCHVKGEEKLDNICYTIFDAENNVVSTLHTKSLTCNLRIQKVHLWHGKRDPYLYTARVTLFSHSMETDCVDVRFGCRTFSVDPQNGFILNGESYPLRGVSRHQDRLGIGNALLPRHHKEDMDLICELGATSVRLAHYQHDPYFYDLCDERGLIVWAEIPYISYHAPAGNDNVRSQLRELILQNYNHPSVVVWGLSNEITMAGSDDPDLIENHRCLQKLAKELDPNRLTAIACLSACDTDAEYLTIPDLIAYNHYFGWYGGDVSMNGPWFDQFHQRHPKTPIAVSEYGCEGLDWHAVHPKQGDYSEEYQAYYHEELIKQLFSRSYLWATFVWNMFDFGADARSEGGEPGQNHKGLITFDRQYKKDAFYAYKAWLSEEPFVHLCGKRFVDHSESPVRITVYSNQPCVALYVNGRLIENKKSDCGFYHFEINNDGESELMVRAGACTDRGKIRKVAVENPDYILKDAGTVLNWYDITVKDGFFSLHDTLGDLSVVPAGRAWVERFYNNLQAHAENMPTMNNRDMLQMLNGFSVLRLTSLLHAMNVQFTKEQMLLMNGELNKIAKS